MHMIQGTVIAPAGPTAAPAPEGRRQRTRREAAHSCAVHCEAWRNQANASVAAASGMNSPRSMDRVDPSRRAWVCQQAKACG